MLTTTCMLTAKVFSHLMYKSNLVLHFDWLINSDDRLDIGIHKLLPLPSILFRENILKMSQVLFCLLTNFMAKFPCVYILCGL